MTAVRPALIARLYRAIEENRMSDAVLLLSQVFHYYGQSRFVRDSLFLSELRRIGDEFLAQDESGIAEEHYKLALALYEAFFFEHHSEALSSVRRLCELLDSRNRNAELSRTLEWAFIIVQRLNSQIAGEAVPAALEAVNWQKLFSPVEEKMVVGGSSTANTQGVQILLVEDNPTDAELLKEHLAEATTEYQFNIDWAMRLADGIRKAGEGNVDVVLLDLSLPDSSDLETFYRLSTTVPSIPVIVLTGNDDRAMAIRAIKRGAHDFLVKGKDDDHVVRSVVEAVERRRHREIERVSVVSATRSVEHSILHAPTPFMFIDPKGMVQNINDAWVQECGSVRADILGKPVWQVCPQLSPTRTKSMLSGEPLRLNVSLNCRTWEVEGWSVDSPDNGLIGALIRWQPAAKS